MAKQSAWSRGGVSRWLVPAEYSSPRLQSSAYAAAIAEFEKEKGPLLGIKADVEEDTLAASVVVYVGEDGNSARSSFSVTRGKAECRPMYDLLIAMCERIRSKGVPEAYNKFTTLAEKTIRVNFYERSPSAVQRR